MTDGADAPSGAVSQARRIELLAGVAAFATVPEAARAELARRLDERLVAADSVVVAEGDVGDRMYLIAEGRAEVSTTANGSAVALQTLSAGEQFGEIALLTPGRTRQATVTALTPLRLLSIDADAFRALVREHPQVEASLLASSDATLRAKFLKQASPFTTLAPERSRDLAAKLEQLVVPAGTAIVQQGERGDACYLVRAGQVEVVVADEQAPGGERRVATLGPAVLFGESALLTDAPRNATVRALELTELLVLRRADLLTALTGDARFTGEMLDLVGQRDRPRRRPEVDAQQRTTDEGDTLTVLKDPRRDAYERLSPDGWFIWQRLDGQHTVEDIARAYEREFGAYMPLAISEVVNRLIAAGFVEAATVRPEVLEPTPVASRGGGVLGFLRGLFGRR
jgi:CRP-like cAMP-binding protein